MEEGEAVLCGEACQLVVDAATGLVSGLEIPPNLLDRDGMRTGVGYDVNSYFTVLTHISPEPGYVLDYVYISVSMGGNPILYARHKSVVPFGSYTEYVRATRNSGIHDESWLERVRPDGSPQSYFELVLLSIVGDQFYLRWHANYHDSRVVCSRKAVADIAADIQHNASREYRQLSGGRQQPEQLQNEWESRHHVLTERDVVALMELDPRPRVEISSGSACVRLVTFSKWGGFARLECTVVQCLGTRIAQRKVTSLVEYNCGIRF